MFGVWAVARQTFSQSLRMKVAAVFIAILEVAIGGMPFYMEGDGTLAGKIRTYLSYSTGLTGVLLALVTVMLSVAVVASDVRDKQIFTVAVKPLPRWQYILGRWLGVVMFDAVLLSVALVGTYALAQYLRGLPTNPSDRRAVETEVFTARAAVAPEPIAPRVEELVQDRVRKMREEKGEKNTFELAVGEFQAKYGGSREEAEARLFGELRKQARQALQSVPPTPPPYGQALVWRFTNVHVATGRAEGTATFQAVAESLPLIRLHAGAELIGRVMPNGPVKIEGVEGRIETIGADFLDVVFRPDDMKRAQIARLREGMAVRITVDPTIQIRYQAKPLGDAPGDVIPSEWRIRNPTTNLVYVIARDEPVRIQQTLTIPARAVDEQGVTEVYYFSRPNERTGTGATVQILEEDISLLYHVGGFEANFVRGYAMIFIQLMFLAALGVCAGSFLSFPVGCLLAILAIPLGLMRDFLTDALKIPAAGGDPFTVLGHYLFGAVKAMLPDFDKALPGESLVEGLLISWSAVGASALWTVGLRVALVLAMACVIFHKRELARVQV